MKTFILVFILHGIFLLAVLDVYFKSNVLSNLNSFQNDIRPPSERLVLFVCDGLPAEYFYDYSNGSTNVPFLRSVIEQEGSWGLSYTRVPTESRPGHIALIAGLYEDPSAVFKGWKENPVLFDTVFNQTKATFMWGCHDILHLFLKDREKKNIYSYSYPSEMQDYSGKEGAASNLDNWVLNKFEEFEKDLLANVSHFKLVHSSQVVFFFHLLGVDVGGHASKPKTSEYINTIKNADRIVKTLVQKIDMIFHDKRTTYLFTSDHGMTDWGSHGAGSPIETITPIVTWGAGIKRPIRVTETPVFVSNGKLNNMVTITPNHWGLSHIVRYDMNQADIAVLMSLLLGLPIPVNSMGILPFPILDLPKEEIANAYLLNAKQLLEQLFGLEKDFVSSVSPLMASCHNNLCYEKLKHTIKKIESEIHFQPERAVNLTQDLILKITDGIKYYEYFFQQIILTHIFHGFACVIIFILGEVFDNWNPFELNTYRVYVLKAVVPKAVLSITCIAVVDGVFIMFLGGALPFYYLRYVLASLILSIWSMWHNRWLLTIPHFLLNNKEIILAYFIYLLGIELLVLSFFKRWVLSLLLIAFCFWPLLDKKLRYCFSRRKFRYWVLSCLSLSLFPSLPIVGNEEILILKVIIGCVWYIGMAVFICVPSVRIAGMVNYATVFQMGVTPFQLITMNEISINYKKGEGLKLHHQVISFTVLLIYLVSMKFGAVHIYAKLLNLSYSIGMSFLLFSMSYDALFPLLLSINLFLWIKYEEQLSNQHPLPVNLRTPLDFGYISLDDFRRSYFFIFYIFVCFFGIGNLASFNSFDTNWIRNFVATFSPFMMMILFLVRIILPFFLVACCFRIVINLANTNAKMLFLIVLLYCDIMAAQFLYMVDNVGSWLEIGTSLTRFIMMESIVLLLLLIYFLAKMCTATVDHPNFDYMRTRYYLILR